MRLTQAFAFLEQGKAISREAWDDPNMVVHGDGFGGWGPDDGARSATGPKDFTQADLEANDWFVVGQIN